jgi:hypothetical protein
MDPDHLLAGDKNRERFGIELLNHQLQKQRVLIHPQKILDVCLAGNGKLIQSDTLAVKIQKGGAFCQQKIAFSHKYGVVCLSIDFNNRCPQEALWQGLGKADGRLGDQKKQEQKENHP